MPSYLFFFYRFSLLEALLLSALHEYYHVMTDFFSSLCLYHVTSYVLDPGYLCDGGRFCIECHASLIFERCTVCGCTLCMKTWSDTHLTSSPSTRNFDARNAIHKSY